MAVDVADAADLGFDPSDPQFIADPYPVLSRLRDAGPVVRYEQADVWLVPRFADVHACLRNRSLGRVFDHRYTSQEFGRASLEESAADAPRFVESERWSLLNLEPPNHTRIRRLVTKVFTARAVAAFTPQVERIAADALARLEGRDGFDVLTELAQPYSIRVICELLGAPVEAGPRMLAWSHAIVKMYELNTSDEQRAEADRAAAEFIEFVTDLIEQRRAEPREDLISELVQVADEGDRLSVDEIVCTVIVLLNAGHEATVNTMGNGLNALLRRRDQWQRVVDGDVDALVAVEEMLRFDPPLQMFERWVLDPVEIGGRQFEVGEKIAMLFGAANRDPERFDGTDEFRVDRGESTHIGFGGGVHFCIGAPLARAELSVMLRALAAKWPDLALAGDPQYAPTFVIRGFQNVDVTTSMRS